MWEQLNRTAVLKRFSGHLDTAPYLLDIKGQSEWVDNYIQFGDLVAEHMGTDACEFYFEQLYELLSLIENGGYSQVQDEPEQVKQEEKKHVNKSGKRVRGNSKRLF